ncbi:hypothetical protein M5362_29145 [Streptomyces sp. Je 1-79]|uniref:hypothetical protein n=1 Tax=Streptomyces sp. Je 1-79 TaxID=2943847 RepID=UPI0021A65C9E|nr:hypothetical protein [Streptomyces sp. Je 1-79]MCT4357183.1 hypothetical protein [Streptomyces sp. Je 1-79]
MSRTVRALAALAALAGVVFGILACGTTTAVAGTAVAGTAVAGTAVVAEAGTTRAPGCGEGHTADGAARPATPPRPNGFGELLPTLTGERTAGGVCGGDQAVRALLPGPEPPVLVPPSPVELSILRV